MAKLENDLLVLNNKVDTLSLRFDPGFDACIGLWVAASKMVMEGS